MCLLLLLLITVSFSCLVKTELNNTSNFTDIDAKQYLKNFGYLDETLNNTNLQQNDTNLLSNGIRKFQELFKLESTGELNSETIRLMQKPRCGVSDFQQNYLLAPHKWLKKQLGWKFLRGTAEDELMASLAFNVWEKNSGLMFHKSITNPDILIQYTIGRHFYNKDCYGNSICNSDFDGPGLVLAHAYYPTGDNKCQEIHLDKSERWYKQFQEPPYGYTSLYNVLLHEIGHTLGLAHSIEDDAIMFSFYREKLEKDLKNDDINGIQSLYGPNLRPTFKTTPLTTTTKRTTITTTTTTTISTIAKTPTKKTTSKNESRTNKPNLCEVKNKLDRFLVIGNHLYLFYADWVWVVSLDAKIISQPVRLLEYIPLAEINFKKGGQLYQRPNGELILFHKNYFYKLDSNNFAVINMKPITTINLPAEARINGAVNTYRGLTYIFYNEHLVMQLDECSFKSKQFKYIYDLFPGIPANISSVFRYTDGKMYFLFGSMVYVFDEFQGKTVDSYKFDIEKIFGVPCQSEGLLSQLKTLLDIIIKKQINISN